MRNQIPKQAAFHGLTAILDMYRNGEGHGYCLAAIGEYLSTLASLKLNKLAFNKHDRDHLVANCHTIEDFQDYLQSKTTVEIDWIDDKDFNPRPVFRGNKHSQYHASCMMLTEAMRGGVNRSACSKGMRNIGSKGETRLESVEYRKQRLANGGKYTGKLGEREHRFTMSALCDYLEEKVYDVRHLMRAMEKHNIVGWVTHEENQRLKDLGLQSKRPADGSDRWDAAGIRLAA